MGMLRYGQMNMNECTVFKFSLRIITVTMKTKFISKREEKSKNPQLLTCDQKFVIDPLHVKDPVSVSTLPI